MSDDKNIWDDSLLIKAYDDSVSLARETLARRIADSTNRREESVTEAEKKDLPATSEPEQEQEQEVNFKVGDFARATYCDGVDYEGVVMSIDEQSETCILRYVGYENEQEVLLADLLPSWGNNARKEQILIAKQADAAAEGQEEEQRPKYFKKNQQPKAKRASGSRIGSASLPAGLVMPPMPLVPPMFTPTAGGVDGEPEQDFVAMLTAWYMSGYYTGLYQGRKESAKTKKKSSKM